MSNTLKLAIAVAIAAVAIASPAAAQLRGRSADGFTMAPPNSTIAPVSHPELTGGGNDGYNDSLQSNEW